MAGSLEIRFHISKLTFRGIMDGITISTTSDIKLHSEIECIINFISVWFYEEPVMVDVVWKDGTESTLHLTPFLEVIGYNKNWTQPSLYEFA